MAFFLKFFCLRRSRRKHLCWNSDTLYLVVYLYNSTVSITVVCMKTIQFSDKTTHRQQAKHSVKTGFVWEWENRIPGLFQDFYIFQGLNFFPILYNPTFKRALFQPEASKWKGPLDFFDSDTGDKNRDYPTN